MEKISSEFTNFFGRKRLRIFFAENRVEKDGSYPDEPETEVHKILKEKRKIPLAFSALLGYYILALKDKEC